MKKNVTWKSYECSFHTNFPWTFSHEINVNFMWDTIACNCSFAGINVSWIRDNYSFKDIIIDNDFINTVRYQKLHFFNVLTCVIHTSIDKTAVTVTFTCTLVHIIQLFQRFLVKFINSLCYTNYEQILKQVFIIWFQFHTFPCMLIEFYVSGQR